MENNNNFVPVDVENADAAPAAAPTAAASISDKAKAMFGGDKKNLLVKIIAAVLAVIIAVVAVFAIVNSVGNNYKRPFKIMEKYANKDKYFDDTQRVIDLSNGFCKSELKTIYKIYKSSDEYKDGKADAKEDFKDAIDEREEKYGKNYRVEYKVEDRETIESEDIKKVRDAMRDAAKELEEFVKETKDWDNEDWKDFAEDLEISKSKAKKLVKTYAKIAKKLKKAKIKSGYTVSFKTITKGSELDEPIENEGELNVYKVNGKWIDAGTLRAIMSAGF